MSLYLTNPIQISTTISTNARNASTIKIRSTRSLYLSI